jgi:two-component system chemotaxis response regulator CheY
VGNLSSVKSLSVYLIEPSSVQAKIIVGSLNAIGVSRIEVFENAQSGLAAMHAKRPDLVLSALYLPDMSGTELINAMRKDSSLEEIAFILVSSETRPQVLEPVRQSGACGILPKPFTEQQLKTALSTTLDYLMHDDSLIEEGANLEELKVLIVDDSKSSRNFVRRVLDNLGIKNILEAENGRQALKLMSETFVDLVITDFNMPEMDGRALIEHIRSESWQQSVPILMVTSEQNKSRLAGIEDSGVSGICDKPFIPDIIEPLIMKILAGNQK